jgi:hypothetical protein
LGRSEELAVKRNCCTSIVVAVADVTDVRRGIAKPSLSSHPGPAGNFLFYRRSLARVIIETTPLVPQFSILYTTLMIATQDNFLDMYKNIF